MTEITYINGKRCEVEFYGETNEKGQFEGFAYTINSIKTEDTTKPLGEVTRTDNGWTLFINPYKNEKGAK
tara:strand:+ start:1259 stop:1468 length:210 start_codon:yes stop_codon:yes gene_type:complete